MNNYRKLSIVFMLALFTSLYLFTGCNSHEEIIFTRTIPPTNTRKPTGTSIPSSTTTHSKAETPNHTETQKALKTLAIAYQVEYDPEIWGWDSDNGFIVLAHRQMPDCKISQTAGRGLGPDWTVDDSSKVMGAYEFSIHEASLKGQLIFVNYCTSVGRHVSCFRVDFSEQFEECMLDAELVISTYHPRLKVRQDSPTINTPEAGRDWLLYISSQEGFPALYAATIDGSNTIKLIDEFSAIFTAALSPNGAKIAISTDSPTDGLRNIYTVNVDGSNLVDLSAERQDEMYDPAWSPDGKRLAFTSAGDIFIINIDDGSLIQLTKHPHMDNQPSWSPDGTRIAFRSERGEDPDIYLINSDGTKLDHLTHDPGSEYMPSWSPDGSMIVYGSSPPDKYGEIHLINADGTGQINLSQHPYMDGNPRWSPDGTQIMFVSERDGQYRNYLMYPDGSRVRPLPELLASVRITDWRYSAVLSSLPSTPAPSAVTPISTPELSSDEEIALALQTLQEFFKLLHDGEYEQASNLYGGSYEMLTYWNPRLHPKDHPMLLKNGCEINGLNCLRVTNAVFQEMTDQLKFHFLVSFEYDDGTVFVLDPCCGATQTEMPPVWQFPYTVKWVNGRLLVMDLPIYIP